MEYVINFKEVHVCRDCIFSEFVEKVPDDGGYDSDENECWCRHPEYNGDDTIFTWKEAGTSKDKNCPLRTLDDYLETFLK